MSRHAKTRTPRERQSYGKAVREFGGDDTEKRWRAETLEGTDQIVRENMESLPLVKLPSWKSRIISNWKKELVVAIAAGIIVFAIQWISEIKVDVKYLEKLLEDTRERIEKIETSNADGLLQYVTKENLELKLQLIEKDLQANIPDISDIEARLKAIEENILGLEEPGR